MATHSSILALKESHGQRSLMCYSPWGYKESDRTEHPHNIRHNSEKLKVI